MCKKEIWVVAKVSHSALGYPDFIAKMAGIFTLRSPKKLIILY